MSTTRDREAPCAGCPFEGMRTAREVIRLIEPGKGHLEFLCHESACLEGDGPEDYRCEGFIRAARRTGLA